MAAFYDGGLHIEVVPFSKEGSINYLFRITFNYNNSIYLGKEETVSILSTLRNALIDGKNDSITFSADNDLFTDFSLCISPWSDRVSLILKYKNRPDIIKLHYYYNNKKSSIKKFNKFMEEITSMKSMNWECLS